VAQATARRGLARVTAITLLLANVTSCQYDPFAHLYLTERPEEHEIAGHYVLTEESLPALELTDLVAAIKLDEDGSYTAVEFPVARKPRTLSAAPGYRVTPPSNFDGTWSLQTLGSVDSGFGSEPMWGLKFDSPELRSAHLASKDGRSQIIFSFDDPDAGWALVFTRE